MSLLSALCSGLIFGFGLLLSGMINPSKVLHFLDIAGGWDPSLAFVMLGAIAVATIGFRLASGKTHALLGGKLALPTKTRIDASLIAGNILFGLGWGLAGYCPGPAIVSLGLLSIKAVIFVVAMLVGMWLHNLYTSLA